jgi:hypothetical protein
MGIKRVKKCNICRGLQPNKKRKDKSRECLGHIGIKPRLWNFHPEFSGFHKKALEGEEV